MAEATKPLGVVLADAAKMALLLVLFGTVPPVGPVTPEAPDPIGELVTRLMNEGAVSSIVTLIMSPTWA